MSSELTSWVSASSRRSFGNPATAIVHLADQEHVDMIVMPTHGRTGLFRLLMGSVAEEVVRKARCPVLTVKAAVPAKARAKSKTESQPALAFK